MTANGLLQIALFVALLLALVKPLGVYMARVYEGKTVGIDRVLGPVERLFYRARARKPTGRPTRSACSW
jgi:K+-transporting ATPase ATPase A chain